jgi:hypothetical protein
MSSTIRRVRHAGGNSQAEDFLWASPDGHALLVGGISSNAAW